MHRFLVLLGCACAMVAAARSGAASAEDPLVPLGRALFFDISLSTPAGQSCSSCHDPQAGFAEPERDLPVSRGALEDRFGARNAQSVAYAAFSPPPHYDATPQPGTHEGMYVGGFFWDGRAKTLEEQAKEPFLNPLEMNNPDRATVVASVRRAAYAPALDAACGAGTLAKVEAAFDCAAKALAAYLRSPAVSPFTAKFDLWRAGMATLAPAEARGYELFTGKAKCKNRHVTEPGPEGKVLFANFGHHNTGVPRNPESPFYRLPTSLNPDGEKHVDRGLGDTLRKAGAAEAEAAREDGKFKVPSLRNVAVTPPYMHNGIFKTLREVVAFNNARNVAGGPPPEVPQNVHRHVAAHAAPLPSGSGHGAHGHMAAGGRQAAPAEGTFGRLGLTDREIDDLVAFLMTLTDGYRP